MLLYSQTHLHNLLDRLETSDARTTGQLEALTVWVAALVQSHPDGERLRATAQALSARSARCASTRKKSPPTTRRSASCSRWPR